MNSTLGDKVMKMSFSQLAVPWLHWRCHTRIPALFEHCVKTGNFDSDYTALIGVSASELEKAFVHCHTHLLYSASCKRCYYINS